MTTRLGKIVIRTTLAIVFIPLILFSLSLWRAQVQVGPSGVHERLFMPVGPGAIKIPLHSGTADRQSIPGFLDGPVVKLAANGTWRASWFCDDKVVSHTGAGALTISCGGRQHRFDIASHSAPPDSVLAMPAKVLMLSDIEGNSAFFDETLQQLGVMDASGVWTYGANRLIIAGDAVDRGRDVFAVLWRLHGLSLQAAKAGGGVTLVLGNHDQYLLRGNMTRAHREHVFALEQLGGQATAFAADTVIGEWLRQQPVMLKVGRVLVTHGGVSPVVAAQGHSVAQLNDAMRAYWLGKRDTDARLNAVLGNGGITQYRGYFEAMDGVYPKATQADIDQAAAAFDVDTFVVGHTIIDKITPMFNGRVYPIDVNSNTAAPEALLFEDGIPRIVRTSSRLLPDEETSVKVKLRPIDLTSSGDWAMLKGAVKKFYALSKIPDPY